ncbi:MAG: hypothetical protein ACOH5I_12215 [Oligoflexus sp.]
MNVNDLYEQRNSYYLQAPPALRGLVLGALIIGLLTLIYGFVAGHGTRVWGSFLFNLFFFFCIGLGAMAFSAIQDVISATWSRPIRRIYDAFGAFVPVGGALLLLYLVAVAFDIGGAGKVYSWIENPKVLDHFPGKDRYLQPGWMYVRVVITIVAIVGVALWQFKQSLPQDRLFVAGQKEDADRLAEAGAFKLRFWSAPILIVYGIAFTSLCFDLTMSLAPEWFSTLWGGWQFAVMMQTLMASMLISMFALHSTKVGQFFQRQQFHDVGKLMHGFTIFFAYLTYAHVLTYWYANMPETTGYLIHRMEEPWFTFVRIVPILGFFIPLYALLIKKWKWTAAAAVPLASMILLAQWFSYLLIVMPQVLEASEFGFPLIEVGLFLGMFGLFAGTFIWFAKRYPMIPLSDPLMAKALSSDHH